MDIMNREVAEQKIKEATAKIVKEYKPEKVVLFGSRAWGEPNSDSDIDLFIIKDTKDRRIERARKVREAIWGLGAPVDLLVYTPNEVRRRIELDDFFISDITTKGKVLYDATRSTTK